MEAALHAAQPARWRVTKTRARCNTCYDSISPTMHLHGSYATSIYGALLIPRVTARHTTPWEANWGEGGQPECGKGVGMTVARHAHSSVVSSSLHTRKAREEARCPHHGIVQATRSAIPPPLPPPPHMASNRVSMAVWTFAAVSSSAAAPRLLTTTAGVSPAVKSGGSPTQRILSPVSDTM